MRISGSGVLAIEIARVKGFGFLCIASFCYGI
jgi:hypothetical protein